MIWGQTYQEEFSDRSRYEKKYYGTWYKWFAWYPVVIESTGRNVWRQTIYKKRRRLCGFGRWRWTYELHKE